MATQVTQAGERHVSAAILVALVLLSMALAFASLFGGAVVLVPLMLGAMPVAIGGWYVFHRRCERDA